MVCRLCRGMDLRLFYTQGNSNEFRFYRCPVCHLVNLDLSEGLNQKKYGEVFIEHTDQMAKQNRMQKRSWFFIRNLFSYGFKGRILDIGCGNGSLLRMAREDGWTVSGIELLPSLAEGASRSLGIDILQCDFLKYKPSKDDNYDLIVLRHVLEHIPDCRSTMDKCSMMLASGGKIYLELPNIYGITFRMKRFGERLGIHRHRYRDDYVPGHCNEYCMYSLKYLAKAAGLKVTHWSTYSSKASMDWLYRILPMATKARALLATNDES